MASTLRVTVLVLAFMLGSAEVQQRGEAANGANPIRKVVTMLETMQKKVAAEGEKEKELYEKFACYCKTNGQTLKEGLAASQTKIPAVASEIEEAVSQKAQLEEALKQHKSDRSDAKAAIEQANALREKEATAYAKEKATYDSNIEALTKAITAISKGMAGGFLQTGTAQIVRKLVMSQELNDPDRQELLAFLSGTHGSEYAPKSGEITGILQQIKDDMMKSLADSSEAEASAVAAHGEMIAAKKKEVLALTQSIEEKSQRVGELGVAVVTMKHDLSDEEQSVMDDTKFLADLEGNCESKAKDWQERSKTRSEELVALAETIKVLNSDDALELFKKTLPGGAASLVQVRGSAAVVRQRAAAVLRRARQLQEISASRPDLDFILLAVQGKKVGLEKVMKMIDDLVENLKKEQIEDDSKKEYCGQQLDEADDKKKDLERVVSDHEAAITQAEEGVSTLKDEVKAVEVAIKALDKSVAESTSQRKQEHEDFTELMSSNSAAKDVLHFAINRLNKFYNPKLHQPELIEARVAAHQQRDAPPPPPETFGAYQSKGEASAGVITMLNMLIKDLDKEMTEAETSEENSQKDYEALMKDAAATRAGHSKALTDKKAALAAAQTMLQEHSEGKASTNKELAAHLEFIQSLHSECDWLLKYFEPRKEARASEIDSLKNAKAILSGSDFSFVQSRNILRRN
eukprot:CAMPEP_0170612278 /NCGR_PEP_ID=MMETSP0224-20130122/23639_1 /TAXON_ID=285029 /ORGANISM="Togula jolla, Strain CCCM 725" /LENGTH=689 /DNA_ID=CAMNT_0010937773 /DNA_START=66 /DNA_END=2135 /DNA_ORIENTATION=-